MVIKKVYKIEIYGTQNNINHPVHLEGSLGPKARIYLDSAHFHFSSSGAGKHQGMVNIESNNCLDGDATAYRNGGYTTGRSIANLPHNYAASNQINMSFYPIYDRCLGAPVRNVLEQRSIHLEFIAYDGTPILNADIEHYKLNFVIVDYE